jgi:mRNA-degrading endonuclease RelE of RelBE toxin-antitoxin system
MLVGRALLRENTQLFGKSGPALLRQEPHSGIVRSPITHQPIAITRNRKKLRPNQLAEWELRIVPFRVFYDIDANNSIVKIVAVGYKQGNTLFIHGEAYEL